eukprot:gene10053-2226_t
MNLPIYLPISLTNIGKCELIVYQCYFCMTWKAGAVLVHDLVSLSLAPAFVVAFLISQHNLTARSALKLIQMRRGCVSLNQHLMVQMEAYESMTKARKDTSVESASNMPKRKRQLLPCECSQPTKLSTLHPTKS